MTCSWCEEDTHGGLYCSAECREFDATYGDACPCGCGEVGEHVEAPKLPDAIDPTHYREHPSGVDCITITEHMNFCLGNAVKYVWRAGLKGEAVEDLEKAAWYIDREIQRLKGGE